MRSLSRRRLADGLSVLLAGALLNVAVFQSLRVSPEQLALFAAVAIAAEAIQRREHELLPDALGGERFSLTSPIQIAAILVAGPWVGAAVAGWSVVAVGLFRNFEVRRLLGRAGALAAAALAGGFAFELAGGIVGVLRLPDDVMPAALAGLVYVTVRTLLEGLVTRRASLPDLVSSASAIGLGIALAFAALYELWLAFALAPMLLLVERLYGRVVTLRGEMATALETFANIVDERDASTYGHSLRVANYVNDLAASLGLPRSEVQRLWWAGRLHDLGKVAVDASVLGKPGKLSPAEWGTVWRAPRLSARLLQRFRFAAQQAQAVEYHRERFNGTGYYRVSQENIPLAAHFLILADAFDAMTTDKPFRERMGREEALAEIERESGSQFHPVIAKAFIAIQRGQDPATVLTPQELAEIRDASVPPPSSLPTLGELFHRPEVTALAGGALLLVGLGTAIFPLAVAGVVTTLVGLKLWHSKRRRVARLTKALHETFRHAADHAQMFGGFIDAIDKQHVWPLVYAAFVEWAQDGSGGTATLERGAHRPPDTAIVSWLLREAESGRGLVVDEGVELPSVAFAAALPLRRDNSALVGFILLCGKEEPAAHVLPALEACIDALGPAFGEARPADVLRLRKENVKRLGLRRRREARTLEA
jgi:HD-GYP domain-containing protein (c-di-GMP phosphodiesterase class II)